MIRKRVVSTNVTSVGYFAGVLEVEFHNGAVYHYYGVPESYYTQMTNYPHPGTFLSRNVKGRYYYERVV